jgi:DUF1680 family protein
MGRQLPGFRRFCKAECQWPDEYDKNLPTVGKYYTLRDDDHHQSHCPVAEIKSQSKGLSLGSRHGCRKLKRRLG